MNRKTKILVVDDNPGLLSLTAQILRTAGYEVLEATTGEACLQKTEEEKPDLILMDVVLPDIDGFQLCRQIKSDPQLATSFVLLISGMKTSSTEQVVGLEEGADGFIIRPIGRRELLARIKALVRLKQAESSLKESEARFRKLLNQNADAILVVDRHGIVHVANPAAEALFHCLPGALVGTELGLPVTDNKKSEIDIICANAGPKVAEMRSMEIEWEGDTAYLVSLRDITERKEAEAELNHHRYHLEELVEERTAKLSAVNQQLQQEIGERKRVEEALRQSRQQYKDLVNSIDGIVWEADAETFHFTFVSPQAERLSGYPPEQWLEDPGFWASHIHPDDRAWALSFCQEATRQKKDHEFEYRMVTANGDIIWLRDIVTVVVKNDKPAKLRGIMVDITEHKQTEEQVKYSLQEKEVLLKEIHHRVKNNLQIISSLLYLQAKKIEDEQVLEIFQEGQNRIKSMALVHEKLYQSKNLAWINFTEYVSTLTNYLFRSYGASSPQISRRIKIDKNLQLAISTAIPCGLIINELVSNALKYSFPPGLNRRGEIFIAVCTTEMGQSRLIIGDDGIGLPPEIDLQSSRSLGLQLVNNLVRQLDGTIEVDRRAGTTYTITF